MQYKSINSDLQINLPLNQKINTFRYLENEINKTSLKMMEADMVKKKYAVILEMLKKVKLCLSNDAFYFIYVN